MKTLIVLALLLPATAGLAQQYTTSWIGNTYGDNAHHVGNCARAMWVSPGGIIYTSSNWDENGRNIGIYQNGVTLGSMGGTSQSQGSAISGDTTWIFAAQEKPNNGKIGRYNRATLTRDLLFQASSGTIDCIRGIAVLGGSVYVSDSSGNRVAVFTEGGVLLRSWSVHLPGPITVDSQGHVWVTSDSLGKILQFDSTGVPRDSIVMDSASRPVSLFVDNAHGQLWVGDKGPDMNIKIYGLSTGTLAGTFGVTGGYLNESTGIRGQTGDKRFTRVVGIGRDATGHIYVLNNPWGGTWDLGRNGATDIHCYDSAGCLQWTLQALNFEGNAAADTTADLYSGNIIYHFTGTGGACYKANTVDPYRYPHDARIQWNDHSRGEHFGHLATVGGHRILFANNQNADIFYTYYFNPATDGYIAIPYDTISHIRNGFDVDSVGDLWLGIDKTNAITHYPLTGFASNGQPLWGAAVTTPTPSSIAPLNRLGYLPASDKMVLDGGSTDWTLLGNRIEVYNGWLAGNRTPNTVITLSRGQGKSMAVAGNYVFIGYYAVPDIDVFDLDSGHLVLTLVSNDSTIYIGNDVDSEYGVQAYHKADGTYVITKDDYNGTKIVVYTWAPFTPVAAVRARPATVYPNPVRSTLNVPLGEHTSGNFCVRIVDLSGKVLRTTRVSAAGSLAVGVADLRPGLYILTVADLSTHKMISESKFIKE
ncbi:T9SS type A sorting domain-containing protein [Dinghuibacter silviterrae]|uniref:Putative secreted protein (Por secretion system target) n=1 Tax=Dinghuibacter silviterrae TaxID=1539049 RepID=A0A4R8DIB8_9BACT|nr:T9SS type A sorting domain-containing protein [Dinghuibacter silviterrae]TDW97481.1 putative secreted protein (Por secretion system target) [Dinghuibacter silviterrae]